MIEKEVAEVAATNVWKMLDRYGLNVVLIVVAIGFCGWTINRQNSFIRETLVGLIERSIASNEKLEQAIEGSPEIAARREVAKQ